MKEQDVNFFLNFGKTALRAAAHLPLIIGLLWVIGLCVCRPVCALPVILAAAIIITLKTKKQDAFPLRAALTGTLLMAVALFALLPAPSDITWAKPWERGPLATVDQDTLHLRNVRDFEFYTDTAYDVRYLEEDFNFSELCAVHLIESRHRTWFSACDLLFSFVFQDGRTLVFGPEMRLPVNERPNDMQAFYKSYGLLYIFGTEEDMLRRRTNQQHEYLSFHTLRLTPQQSQNILMECVRLSVSSVQDNEAYPPFGGLYDGSVQAVIRGICPQLPYSLNSQIVRNLYERDLLVLQEGETWERYQRRSAVRFNIATEDRSDYSDAVRRICGANALPATPGKRKVQEETLTSRPKREITWKRDEAQTSDTTGKAGGFHEAFFTTGKGKTLADKIPEPGERLIVDTRDYTDEEYNSDTPEDTNSPGSDNIRAILEPKDRMIAEAKAARAAAEQKERERKAAAEGRFKTKDADGKEKPAADVDYDAMLLGRKGTGIKIIEKEKNVEEAHPLDPYKRRNPFEEEKKKKKTGEDAPEDDFTAKPKPLHL